MRTTALDFFSDGRCAVCTMGGDVWIVSNIDENLQNVTWKRFATGLFEPLGLKIVNDKIYVLGRDQITRLHDLNGDGEADFYENFSNGGVTDPVYHAFNLDLQTDLEGNFYYMVDGNLVPLKVPMHGAVLKVSKDGKKTEVYATGFRAARRDGNGAERRADQRRQPGELDAGVSDQFNEAGRVLRVQRRPAGGHPGGGGTTRGRTTTFRSAGSRTTRTTQRAAKSS